MLAIYSGSNWNVLCQEQASWPDVVRITRWELPRTLGLLLGAGLEGTARLVGHALRQVCSHLPMAAWALGTAPASALTALPTCA